VDEEENPVIKADKEGRTRKLKKGYAAVY